jgi:Ni,Fe-hydrogenase I large subunit
MKGNITRIIPMNRVEGDLELQIEIDQDNVVRQARSVGTMYRGIENLMTGRAPLDSLVITPRICGICTTSHLSAAAEALDMAYSATVPDNARRLRNVTLMVEQVQNDLRHTFLLFMPDCTGVNYSNQPLHDRVVRRYQVLKGETTLQTVQETRKLLEIIAILGGQWPHSSFMVPGGVVSVPSNNDIAQCRHILRQFRRWYEQRVLGCSLERWRAVDSAKALNTWLHEARSHQESDLGLYIRFAVGAGLDRIGGGHGRFISCGGPVLPAQTAVVSPGGDGRFLPAGVYSAAGPEPFDPLKITEDIACSYYTGDAVRCHPYDGRTIPDPDSTDRRKYSWTKAPRYGGRPAETGPLAELLVAGNPLLVDWLKIRGGSVFARVLARLMRPAVLLPAMEQWLAEMAASDDTYYHDYYKAVSTKGYGLVSAPRGFLGHWVTIRNGEIANYQVITPTAWNGSPQDGDGVRGPWEEAVVGTVVKDSAHPVEVEQIIRSFDPCLVCTVHAIKPMQG